MATLNTAFNIATGALEADQAALNIIANNTANANTPGYTNELPQWQANDPVTIDGTSYGQGVTMTGPASQRDQVLEQRIQQQLQLEQGTGARLTALDQLQNIFSTATSASSSSSLDIGTSISSFFSALSQLQATPSSNSLRQSVLSAATTLASAFQSASSQLTQQQGALDQQSGTVVTQVNSLTQAIAQLNQSISQTTPNNQDAGQLQDQRNYDVQQLSQLIGIHQITTDGNNLTITTSSGALLVAKGQAYSLSTSVSGGVTHISDFEGNDITTSLAGGGGQLGGILTSRDQDIPQMQSALDTLAFNLGGALNTANEAGSDANGNPGVAIFNLPSSASGAASTISVAITDPSQIAAAATGAGSSNDANLENMLQVQNQSIVGGDTPSTYYSSFVSTLGSLVSQVSTENTAQQTSLTQLQTQRDSISAVNLNDEAASLENLQQAYQAASKVFTILDTVMASAINLGVETTVA